MPITHQSLLAEIEHRRLLADVDRHAAELIPAEGRAAGRPGAWRGDRRMITRAALLPRLVAMENWQRLAALEDS